MSEPTLRDALQQATARVDADAPPWSAIEARADEVVGRRRRLRRGVAGGLAAAAAIVVVLLAAGVSRNDGRALRTVDPGPSIVAGPPTTTADTAPAEEEPADVPYPVGLEAIWPITSQEDLDLHLSTGSTEHDEPTRTAELFLRRYVGMERAVLGEPVEGEPGPGGRQVDVPVASFTGADERMTVSVAEVVSGGPWTVTGMRSRDIEVAEPLSAASVRSPLALRGRAHAFEGHVTVEVRQDGQLHGERIGSSFVTGGGDALHPFQGNVAFSTPSRPAGAVVFVEESAEDGKPLQATVVRIRFSS